MSENTTNNTNVKDDEIDLLDLFKRMGRTLSGWANALGRAFLITTVFLLRRWLPLGLSIVLAVGYSWMSKNQSKNVYSSELTIRSNAVPNSDMITYVNRLHSFCIENDSLALSAALSMPLENVRFVKDIQAFWAIDLGNDGIPDKIDYKNSYNVNDTVNIRMADRFVVRARVSVPQEFALLRERILEYAGQNSLFQLKNQVRLAQNKEIQVRLIYDINQLDSLQKVKYFEETRSRIPASGGQMIFLQQQNTQLIYSDIYALYSRKQAIDTELELYKDVLTLLNDFTTPARPVNGLLSYCKIYVPIFFIFTLVLLIIFANRKKLLAVYKKY
ncbi:MAG: hypothetical protein WCS03_08520 [Bacteroidota bacterium]